MNTSLAFTKGYDHTICQDYGRSTPSSIILSDGCSSSPDTDVGSRLLVLSTCGLSCKDLFEQEKARQLICATVDQLDHQLNIHNNILNSACLDATLLIAGIHEDKVFIHMFGDGVIVIDYVNGFRKMFQIEYAGNAPFYLNYFNHPKRMEQFILYNSGEYNVRNLLEDKNEEQGKGHKSYYLDTKDIARITLFTDGVASFGSRDGSRVNMIEIIDEFCCYKGTAGDFVQRRCNKALKLFSKKDWIHRDDLTVGCLNLIEI